MEKRKREKGKLTLRHLRRGMDMDSLILSTSIEAMVRMARPRMSGLGSSVS